MNDTHQHSAKMSEEEIIRSLFEMQQTSARFATFIQERGWKIAKRRVTSERVAAEMGRLGYRSYGASKDGTMRESILGTIWAKPANGDDRFRALEEFNAEAKR